MCICAKCSNYLQIFYFLRCLLHNFFPNRALKLKEKITKALDIWISENQALTYGEMIEKLIRMLVMTGMHHLTSKVKALKLCAQLVTF